MKTLKGLWTLRAHDQGHVVSVLGVERYDQAQALELDSCEQVRYSKCTELHDMQFGSLSGVAFLEIHCNIQH